MKTQNINNNGNQVCEVLTPAFVEYFTEMRAIALGLEFGTVVETSEGRATILHVVADKIAIALNGRTVLRRIEELA